MFATGAVSSTSPGATTWRAGGLPRRLAAQGLLAGGFSGSDPPSERCCAGQAMRNLLESHIAIHHMACMACNAAPSLPQLRGLTPTRMDPSPSCPAEGCAHGAQIFLRVDAAALHLHTSSLELRRAHPCTGRPPL